MTKTRKSALAVLALSLAAAAVAAPTTAEAHSGGSRNTCDQRAGCEAPKTAATLVLLYKGYPGYYSNPGPNWATGGSCWRWTPAGRVWVCGR